MIATGATWAQTTAQLGFEWCNVCVSYRLDNHAYYCPDCNNFCSMFSYCQTDRCCKFRFGVITGGINVVIQFFKNLGLTVANIALWYW